MTADAKSEHQGGNSAWRRLARVFRSRPADRNDDDESSSEKHEERLSSAIANAQALLVFSIESRLVVAPELIDEIVQSIDALNTKLVEKSSLLAPEEARFLAAYQKLGVATAPVTGVSVVQSRRASEKSIKVTSLYSLFALTLFLIVAFLWWLWFDGSTLRRSLVDSETVITALHDKETINLRDLEIENHSLEIKAGQLRDAGCRPYAEIVAANGVRSPKDKTLCLQWREQMSVIELRRNGLQREIGLEKDKLQRAKEAVEYKVDFLYAWYRVNARVKSDNIVRLTEELKSQKEIVNRAQDEKSRAEADCQLLSSRVKVSLKLVPSGSQKNTACALTLSHPVVSNLQIAQQAVEATQVKLDTEKARWSTRTKIRADGRIALLERYLLPIVLGAMGAMIYTLRAMMLAIQTSTYTHAFFSLSIVRIVLGAIVGLLGLLVLPAAVLPEMQFLPLAMPLLLGYGVEIFCTALDRLVKAFTESSK